MKVTFNRSALLSAITTASAVVPGKTPKDILKNILISGHGSSFDVVGTDLEIGIIASIAAESVISNETITPLSTLLPPQRVHAILREMPDAEVVLDFNESDVIFKGASAKFRIATEDPREFPPVPFRSCDDWYQVPAPVFAQGIRRTEFAVDNESTRYALAGINIEVGDGACILAATDSRRLSVAKMSCEKVGSPEALEPNTVVPSKAWKAVSAAASSRQDEVVKFRCTDKDATFRTGLVTVYSRLVEGRFPRYRDVIPGKVRTRFNLPCGPFLGAVRQTLICQDESRGANFIFDKGVVLIRSESSVGSSDIEFPCEYDGDKLTIKLDPQYLADFLKTVPAEESIEVSLIDADTAVMFKVDQSNTYVVMPLESD